MVGGCFLPDFFVRLVDRWLGFSENLVVVAETKRGVLAEFGAGDGRELNKERVTLTVVLGY